MPRMLAKEFVYSSADERYNEYITPTSPPPSHYHHQQHNRQKVPAAALNASSTMEEKRNLKSRSQSPTRQMSSDRHDVSPEIEESQLVHTISSSGDGYEKDETVTEFQDRLGEFKSSIISEDMEDFEGFDENSSVMRDHSQEDTLRLRFNLKRHSEDEYNNYREDSEGVVEAIEVDDDEDIEEVDGQIMYRSRKEKASVNKSNRYPDYNPHTPNKRKKRQSDGSFDVIYPPHLKTPPDQIVEINSDSTTISQKQKRQQINSKFQHNRNQKQNHRGINTTTANKCSTESTSEFPVSSPSNPQQPRGGGKYPPRPPLLKNTLPSDSFERQLAMITACNPQMTLAEKIQNWCCGDELSDVEDVSTFDQEFKRLEERRKSELTKQKNKKGTGSDKQYNFNIFHQMIINNMNAVQQNKKRFTVVGGGATGFSAGPTPKGHDDSSGSSESSESIKHVDERPSTSAVAQQQLQQRRCKPPNNMLEPGEIRKRIIKDLPKRKQNSTTPPATSSSENERDCFQKFKLSGLHKRFNPGHIQIHEKLLCPSSSEEANSQDVPTHMQLTSNHQSINNIRHQFPIKSSTTENNTTPKNLGCLVADDIDSVFRLHRLNREIDKHPTVSPRDPNNVQLSTDKKKAETPTEAFQQVQIDCSVNKIPHPLPPKKKQDLFKTPSVPPKYFLNHTSAESPTPTCNSTVNTPMSSAEQITTAASLSVESRQITSSETIATPHSMQSADVKLENVSNSDFDGVYHQQHEFCNYLGLTGMSTATAMANAVAELAQCNLTRRSMRVLRQQQNERKIKSAKEERKLHAVKCKPPNDSRKRDRGELFLNVGEKMTLHEEGTNSQASETNHSNSSINETKKKTASITSLKSSVKSQARECRVKNEPQIKILCHIVAPTNKEEVENVSADEEEKRKSQFTRERLLRQAKQTKELKDVVIDASADIKKEKEFEEIKTEYFHAEELKLEETMSNSGRNNRILRSPRLTAMKTMLKITKSNTNLLEDMERKRTEQFLKEQKEKASRVDIRSPPQSPCKIEVECDSPVTTLNKCDFSSLLTNKDNTTKELHIEEVNASSGGDEFLGYTDRAITPTSLLIKEKLQAALEKSRKTKPSIFIVQSLESKKDITKTSVSASEFHENATLEMISPKPDLTAPISVPNVKIQKEMTNKSADISSKGAGFAKKTVGKKLLRSRKAKTHAISSLRSAPKRELRARKIIVIKTIKTQKKQSNKKFKEIKEPKPKNIILEPKPSKCPYSPNKIRESVKASDIDIKENNVKSFRNAQTETKDLEIYNIQSKTRLMAKASALLQRSRRMSLSRGNANNLRSKLSAKIRKADISIHGTKPLIMQPKVCLVRANIEEHVKKYKSSSTSTTPPPPKTKSIDLNGTLSNKEQGEETVCGKDTSICLVQETENVVVSSTTNSYDERPLTHINSLPIPSPITLTSIDSSAPYAIASATVETKDNWAQCDSTDDIGIRYLNAPPAATQTMANPLKSEHGTVHYIYYEVDILIVVQERLISFWKNSLLLNALSFPLMLNQQQKLLNQMHPNVIPTPTALNKMDILCNTLSPADLQSPQKDSLLEKHVNGEWVMLGELKRSTYDQEVIAPFANRICLHNSTPIYVEMRARELPKNQRDCNLLSLYINIYYYHDEEMIAKRNSIQLDTIQSEVNFVNYTTLIDSRYFIITWPQENLLGKTRSGLCKYSLTPQLDTLASIREFKSMRHTIRYLECMSDDKLVGFGDSQLTIWDHRSGDVLMNYDLEMPLGRNLGSVYYPSQEIEQNNMITLFQYRDTSPDKNAPELLTIACTIAHTQPSYRIVQQQQLPPAFRVIQRAINTGEHLIITAGNDDEIWICCNNSALVALVPQQPHKRHFYNREKSQLIELTEKTLNFDTLANHILTLAAGLALNKI